MPEPGEQDRFEFGSEDPRSLNWKFDPDNPRYADDPYLMYADIDTWAETVWEAQDEAMRRPQEARLKTPEQIDREDITAVLKSIAKPEPQSTSGQMEFTFSPDLDALVAWGSAMKSSNVDREKLADLSNIDLRNVSSLSLRYILLGRKRGATTWDHVTLGDREFPNIFTSPTVFKKRVEARNRRANRDQPYGERIEKAERASEHAHDRVAEQIGRSETAISIELNYLEQVKKLAGSFRFKLVDQATLISLRGAVYELSFKEIIDTAANEQKWSAEERDRAFHAMDARFFFGPQHVKTRYWNQMLDLAIDYAHARNITLERNKRIGRRIMRPAS